MKKFILIAAFLLPSLALAGARDEIFEEWKVYRQFLSEPACASSNDTKFCEGNLMEWKRAFRWATDKSFGDLHLGQSNVSNCLSTGCDGMLPPQPVLACAWAKLALGSGNETTKTFDVSWEQAICSSLDVPSRELAGTQAERLMKMIEKANQ